MALAQEDSSPLSLSTILATTTGQRAHQVLNRMRNTTLIGLTLG